MADFSQEPDDTPIQAAEPFLSVRTYNCLAHNYGPRKGKDILTVGEIRAASNAELLRIENFGLKSLRETRQVLGTIPIRQANKKVRDPWTGKDSRVACQNCRYWYKEDDGFGECRRNAPTSFLPELLRIRLNGRKSHEDSLRGGDKLCGWPTTPEYAWCGEFNPMLTHTDEHDDNETMQ